MVPNSTWLSESIVRFDRNLRENGGEGSYFVRFSEEWKKIKLRNQNANAQQFCESLVSNIFKKIRNVATLQWISSPQLATTVLQTTDRPRDAMHQFRSVDRAASCANLRLHANRVIQRSDSTRTAAGRCGANRKDLLESWIYYIITSASYVSCHSDLWSSRALRVFGMLHRSTFLNGPRGRV